MGAHAPGRVRRWVGTSLIAVGALILVATGGLYAYSQYEEMLASREAALITPVVVPATPLPPAPTETPLPASPRLPDAAQRDLALGLPSGVVAEERRAARPTAVPTPTPLPTPVPIYPAERIVAKSIGLDSKVVESPIVNDQWVVPKFVAGHLAGTAQPLEGGNVVLSGHVESISSGNVFAHIGDLQPGDVVQLYTRGQIITYTVDKVIVVRNNDLSVVQPTTQERLTLITCTGTWLPLQHDFDRRIVVVANRVG